MINQLDVFANEEFVLMFTFIVSILFAFLIAKGIGLAEGKQILAIHVLVLMLLIMLQLIDFLFIAIAIIEILLLTKTDGGNSSE